MTTPKELLDRLKEVDADSPGPSPEVRARLLEAVEQRVAAEAQASGSDAAISPAKRLLRYFIVSGVVVAAVIGIGVALRSAGSSTPTATAARQPDEPRSSAAASTVGPATRSSGHAVSVSGHERPTAPPVDAEGADETVPEPVRVEEDIEGRPPTRRAPTQARPLERHPKTESASEHGRVPTEPDDEKLSAPPVSKETPTTDNLYQNDEIALFDAFGAALRADGSEREVLALVELHQRLFPRGQFVPERVAAKARALCRLGRKTEGVALAREFGRRWPTSGSLEGILQDCNLERAAVVEDSGN
ncbi:MAG: hypothetical protein AAF799_39470 [Myxococcota bacterium]